jgi:hypothetical protein
MKLKKVLRVYNIHRRCIKIISENSKFVDIPGYEGLYEINKKGEIWSNYKEDRILKQRISKDGYISKNV